MIKKKIFSDRTHSKKLKSRSKVGGIEFYQVDNDKLLSLPPVKNPIGEVY